jgi:hypothetical protein
VKIAVRAGPVWATFAAAMAEATATLEHADQAELVTALEGLADATRALADSLSTNAARRA